MRFFGKNIFLWISAYISNDDEECDNTDDICKKQFYQQKYYSTNNCGIGAGNQPHCTIRDELACSSMTELGSHVNNLGFIDKHENNNWQTLCKICNPIIDTEETLNPTKNNSTLGKGSRSIPNSPGQLNQEKSFEGKSESAIDEDVTERDSAEVVSLETFRKK